MNTYKYNFNEVRCEFRKDSRINLDANKVYKELQEISNKHNGQLLTQDVVNYARQNKTSELYKGFEWNDTKAAEQYRLQQASRIIYNIRILPLKQKEDKKVYNIEIIPFTHLDNKKGYESTITIIQNEDKYKQLKQQAYNDLMYWRRKYSMIIELENIFKDIDNLNI